MCEQPDVKVVSVSYSGGHNPDRRAAAAYCKSQGALMVNSAGNDDVDRSNIGNADDDDLIVVGATDINDNKSSFSAYGSYVDVWAPGYEKCFFRSYVVHIRYGCLCFSRNLNVDPLM